ncbi:hypothetical protein D3C75_1339730 [compost metagenome]
MVLLKRPGKGRMGAKPVLEGGIQDFVVLTVPYVPGRQRETPPPHILGDGHAGDIHEYPLE